MGRREEQRSYEWWGGSTERPVLRVMSLKIRVPAAHGHQMLPKPSLYFTWPFQQQTVCAVPGVIWPTAACAAPGLPRARAAPMRVSVYIRFYTEPGHVCLEEPVLYLYVCFYVSPGYVCLKEFVLDLYVSV
jgi:hypothetical protein